MMDIDSLSNSDNDQPVSTHTTEGEKSAVQLVQGETGLECAQEVFSQMGQGDLQPELTQQLLGIKEHSPVNLEDVERLVHHCLCYIHKKDVFEEYPESVHIPEDILPHFECIADFAAQLNIASLDLSYLFYGIGYHYLNECHLLDKAETYLLKSASCLEEVCSNASNEEVFFIEQLKDNIYSQLAYIPK